MQTAKNYFEHGLTQAEVEKNLKKYGYNEFPEKADFTILKILLSQFSSILIIILLITGLASIFLKELFDGIIILIIVVINAIIGFIQEYKAENAVKALKKLVVPTTIVIRDGEEKNIPVKDVVPGDLIKLYEGDKVPADAIILEAFSLKVDESVLTGESVPSSKQASSKNDKENKLFKGTLIVSGKAKAQVTETGLKTEFGKIVELVSRQVKTKSPLTVQLDVLGRKLGIIILILIVILFILGYLRGVDPMSMLMTSVALGVSAIPEGMPIIVTLTLAIGVQAMAKKKAIVRKMSAIESLGATTIICSDKTGTLTLNEMTVKKINTSFKEVSIKGIGYSWNEKIKLSSPEEKKLMEICENCNNSFIGKTLIGDPTEIALKVLTRKADYVKNYKELDENVFTSERKMMSNLNKIGNNKEIFAKGAFEVIIKNCTHLSKNGKIIKLTTQDKHRLQEIADTYAREQLRVLGFAYKPYKNGFTENNLIFIGLVGMLDPPRKSVKSSIEIAQTAGIKIKIITGDNPLTAASIGEKIGLKVTKVVLGEEIDKLSDNQLKKLIYETQIFARTSPQHKYRIVNILKENQEVVAVTGDGVNDAPALKHANVGIAMGIKGTEATKEVADIILKDDNFTTIVNTIEEGRRIYQNILAFIKYMLAANFDEIIVVGVITIMGYPLPILPLQILWLNLATDALPALALGNSPADKDIMLLPPHPKNENIFKKLFNFILIATLLQTIANIGLYFYGLHLDKISSIDSSNIDIASHARTLVFTQIVLFELLFAFICKQDKPLTLKSFISNKSLINAALISLILQLIMIYAPLMQKIFLTTPLSFKEWGILLLTASTSLLVPYISRITKKIFKLKN